MKKFKKLSALILALVMIFTFVGCNGVPLSTSQEWSYKTADDKLAIGVYIYSLYSAYSKAETYAKNATGYDATKSFMDLQITDDDGNKAKAKDWILKEADKITKTILAVDTELRKMNVTASPDQVASAEDYAKLDWEQGGQYASYYAQMGYSVKPYKEYYEPYGISYDSYYVSTYLASVNQDALFRAIYDVGGTKPVSDADVKDYFEKNYTNYSYFQVKLSKTETDSAGNSNSTALTDSEISAIKKNLDKYADMMNKDKKSFKDVITQYMKDYTDVTSDPSTTNTEILKDSKIGDDLVKEIGAMNNSEAKVVKIGSGTDASYYFIYKDNIKNQTTDYLKSSRISVVSKIKNDEFNTYLEELASNLNCEINTSVINKYNPTMFEDFSNASSSQATADSASK